MLKNFKVPFILYILFLLGLVTYAEANPVASQPIELDCKEHSGEVSKNLKIVIQETGEKVKVKSPPGSFDEFVEAEVADVQVDNESSKKLQIAEVDPIAAIESFPSLIYQELKIAEWDLKRIKSYVLPPADNERNSQLFFSVIYKGDGKEYAGAFGMNKEEPFVCYPKKSI